MHLSAASVDLDGNIIAIGTITHSQDDRAEFMPREGNQLRISRGNIMTIMRCSAVRDESGFMCSEEYGAAVIVPAALATDITRILRFGAKVPHHVTIRHQDGELASSLDPAHHFTQPLSDWLLNIEDQDGDVVVTLSAALQAHHLRDWLPSEADFWAKQPGQRVDVRLRVDPATRIACYGAILPGISGDETEELPTLPPFDGSRLNLANAPIGKINLYGIRDGRWVNVSLGSPWGTLAAFTEHSDVKRLSTGFLSNGNYVWPRLWLSGLDFGAIVQSLEGGTVRLSGTGIKVVVSDDRREGSSQTASDAAIELDLGAEGLVVRYSFNLSGRVVDQSVTLPWELLILRYPSLARRRPGLIAGTGAA